MRIAILKTFLVMVMILAGASTANADYSFSQDGLFYSILSENDCTVAVVDNYNNGDVEIPKEIVYNSKTYTVTSIGDHAFDGCSGVTSVAIPNSVTSIGDYAFYDCSGLTGVAIPNSVTSIGKDAFNGCSGFTSVEIPSSVTSIGEGAFGYCSRLTSVAIPNSVTSIGKSAFMYCIGLTSVKIPNSVTSIGNHAFWYCSELTEINVDVENPTYMSDDGIVYTKDRTSLLICPEGKKGEVSIPNTVTSIGLSAFEGCSRLTSVVIPNSVTSIGNRAFYGCSGLASVAIPNSVTEIVDYTFYDCSGLASVEIPNSITSIGAYVFGHCSGLTRVVIPNSVTSIGEYAFYHCSGLTSVEIPNSVISIDEGAFEYCSGLTSVTIPSSVTSIGEYAFNYCSLLESIYCQWTEPIECSPYFSDDVIKNAVLYVPKGFISAYEKVDPWKTFLNIKEMEYMAGVEDAVSGDDVEVKVVGGDIVAEGCTEMAVYSMSGQLVYRGAGRAENLAAGVYVVRVADKTLKVMVAR